MIFYPIERVQLSFPHISILCYELCILSKTECMSIWHHFRPDHKGSAFQKLAVNKWILGHEFHICVSNELDLGQLKS